MSLGDLAMRLGISPPAVWYSVERVENMARKKGYWSPFPHKGVRVVDAWHLGLLWFQSDLKPSIKGLDF